MAAPTQAYPPWLSPVPVTVTQDGAVAVQTTVTQFPQTYYGPSIPLGPGWVFGGSTFPASIATSFATSTPSTSTASTPSPSQSSSTSAPTSSVSPSSISSTSSTSTSPNPVSSSPAPNLSHGVSSGTRLAVILSTILGALLLATLLVVLCRIRRRRQRSRGLTSSGNFSGWQLVNPSAAHQPLEGAAEEGEAAAFLSGEHGMREQDPGPTLSHPWPKPPPQQSQVGQPVTVGAGHAASRSSGSGSATTKTESSTLDSAAKREDLLRFNASGSTVAAGSLFFNPARGNGEGSGVRKSEEEAAEEAALAAGVAAALASTSKDYSVRPPGAGPPRVPVRSPARPTGHVDPSYNLISSSSPGDNEPEEEFLPPRRLDPDRLYLPQTSQPSSGSRGSWVYPESPPSETDERATLLTARRVNVGPVSHPVLASSPSEKEKDESLEGWVTPPGEKHSEEPVSKPESRGSWATSIGMGGLTGFARGLGRLSWFRRMDNEPGPSGTRHSSPSRSHRGPRSRPTSGVGFVQVGRRSRPQSGLLHPGFASRPQSGVSLHGVDAELGMRSPGLRISGTGSGSGNSGGTVYHSASSRPQTPMYVLGSGHARHEGQLVDIQPHMVPLPPDLDLGEGGNTIRSVDVLDLPVPERALPFSAPVLPDPASSRAPRPDTASSRGTGMAFPPGLVAVPHWDKHSHSSSSNRETEERDVLEDEPPQAAGDWSSLRSKSSAGENEDTRMGRRGPVTRSSTGEQAVLVTTGEPATSETASFSSAPRHAADTGLPGNSTSPRSPTGFGILLTPRVSLYASSHSDLFSHSGSGSHSSRPSQYSVSHSQELSQPGSNHESEDGHHLPRGPASHRASLSAMGGGEGPPPLPPVRPFSNMEPTMERTSEDRETEEESGTSRPGTGTSRPTLSETATQTGTFASGTASTGALTTVPSTTGSLRKR